MSRRSRPTRPWNNYPTSSISVNEVISNRGWNDSCGDEVNRQRRPTNDFSAKHVVENTRLAPDPCRRHTRTRCRPGRHDNVNRCFDSGSAIVADMGLVSAARHSCIGRKLGQRLRLFRFTNRLSLFTIAMSGANWSSCCLWWTEYCYFSKFVRYGAAHEHNH
jgi:hypothetical protein